MKSNTLFLHETETTMLFVLIAGPPFETVVSVVFQADSKDFTFMILSSFFFFFFLGKCVYRTVCFLIAEQLKSTEE